MNNEAAMALPVATYGVDTAATKNASCYSRKAWSLHKEDHADSEGLLFKRRSH